MRTDSLTVSDVERLRTSQCQQNADCTVDCRSTHRLTDEQKRALERQQARRAEAEAAEAARRREADEKKRMACDDAFDAWLERKRVEAAQRRRERVHEMRDERLRNCKNKVSPDQITSRPRSVSK